MPRILRFDDFDAFKDARYVRPELIPETVLQRVKTLKENRLEAFLRQILIQPYSTPHGPTELSDILCTMLVRGRPRLAAFTLKGKSFQRITDKDVAHQFVKATSIPLLRVMAFVAVGDIQDSAVKCLSQEAVNAGCDILVVNRVDLSRLLIAYGKICPHDGRILKNQHCKCGFVYDHQQLFVDLKIKATRRTANRQTAVTEGRAVSGSLDFQGMPTVLAVVIFPRLGVHASVNFLIDTGADITLISAFDAMRVGIKTEQLAQAEVLASLGGSFTVFSEPAIMVFMQEDNVLLSYEATVRIPELTDITVRMPSVLGRDVIGNMGLYLEPRTGPGESPKRPGVFLIPRC